MNTIKLKYGLEDITSRIPGLFSYVEFDENHVSTIHPASDSSAGCYGKVVSAIRIPNNVSLDVDNLHIVIGGNVYSYRTLIGYYYTYRDTFPTNSFIQFMENGIGRFKISDLLPINIDGEWRTIDFDECVLVPEYEYYANSARLYSTYKKIQIMCSKYLEIKEATGEINCELECLLDKYAKMGGDVMLEFYKLRSHESSEMADIYYGYATEDLKYSFNINIVSNNNDLGILNTFLNYFDPDETYYNGDEVIYNDRTYKCIVTTPVDNPHHKGPWDSSHFHLISDTGPDGEETVYIPRFRSNEYYHRGEFVRMVDYGQVYVCDLPEYIKYDVGDVIDVGDTYYIKDGDVYRVTSTLALPHTIVVGEEYYYKGPEIYHGGWSTDIFKPKDITGFTNSKLIGFRNNNNYIDAGGSIRIPEETSDWLWYYHIGDIGFYETSTDEFNNIELITGQRVSIGEYETKLMAYGDIITDIRRDTDAKTITFDYVIGAHLKAKYLHNYADDDNNPHYCYGEFEYDGNDLHGVFHTETYNYLEGGEIDSLSDEDFQKYVSYNKFTLYSDGSVIKVGDIYFMKVNDEYVQYINQTSAPIVVPTNNTTYYYEHWTPARRINDVYSTCEFDSAFNSFTAETMINGNNTAMRYIVSDFSSKFDREMDTLCSTTTKIDYLTGIMYGPTVKNDVRVRRGNAAAWERHIKLGEIRSFDDLETYANGGFFNLR